ncbi:NADP oxidoreductase [Solemya velesiana gill symbiont]|uniref:NADH-quinone oxidoreductase subunit F n=2 Tax=Solemya velesiana gill symbiont TaxID=1918948 RepID=A0A1T2KWB5_9GAMM|nr:NADH-ubiquinone oxidoreductase-F iron-sulfur binding region domain-containing protein [Solemya velesiana gill symbiont]OOZ37147.1 NADP oxidoreductase [Solemya velesiana gill symbiont]
MTDDHITETTNRVMTQWNNDQSNLLQMLIDLQQALNGIPESAINQISAGTRRSPADIESVIGFYSFLHHDTHNPYRVLFSDNITDRMLGSRALAEHLNSRLQDIDTATVDYTSCTGMGDQGPAALVNGHTLTRLDKERIDQMAALMETNTPLSDWPAEWFRVDENIRRRDLLLETDFEKGSAIKCALESGAEKILEELDASGLRGRGGAGFKTAMKWRFCREATGDNRVVVCNADEGEPGTFKDRLLLQSFAERLIEGMTVCAKVIGATTGFIYLRGEYLYLRDELESKLQRYRDAGLLSKDIHGEAGFDFDIKIHLGAGAYICGEESALIESLEGKRGIPRIRPPFPVTSGYLNRPTVVNNVETLVAAAMIAVHGAAWFRTKGTEQSPGTKLLSISGNCLKPGIYEYPFGTSLEVILKDCEATHVQAVQIAGAAGSCIPPSEFSRSIAFEDLATGGSFMIFDRERNLLEMVQNFTDFFVHESCGFCTPCRVGTSLLKKRLAKVASGRATGVDLEKMRIIGSLTRQTSHCGLGMTAANPILETLDKFPHIYEPHLLSTTFEPAFNLDASLEEARQITGRDDPDAHLQGGGV